jgi:uncharacterized protein (TIGR02391 family)
MAKKAHDEPQRIEAREFRSPEEIDLAIAKLQRRIEDLKKLDVEKAYLQKTGADDAVISHVRETIRDVFGSNSPEFREHQYISLWHHATATSLFGEDNSVEQLDRGRSWVVGILEGLIARLVEKKEDLTAGTTITPATCFDRLNLHPRIRDVSRDLFVDGHPWEAVFAASKALINYVKDRSSNYDLDGAALVRTVFSRNNPILAFNDLATPTDLDEQEGMMHLFEGAALAIRNPGGHSFPKGSDQRALEYISFLSLLAYRLEGAKRRK